MKSNERIIKWFVEQPIRILLFGGGFVLAFWVVYGFAVKLAINADLQSAGLFGDMYGGLNVLFAGFAFTGLLATIAYQHKEISDARSDFRELKQALKNMTDAMELQAEATQVQTGELTARNKSLKKHSHITALVARIEHYDTQIDRADLQARPRLIGEQLNLAKELDELLNMSRSG